MGTIETDTTRDVFLGGKLTVWQPREGYRAGLDAVVLAASVPAADARSVLDVGAGVGVVGLALAARLPGANVTLVERDPLLADLAWRNVSANQFNARMALIEADISAPLNDSDWAGLKPGGFEHVVANPPYVDEGAGRTPANALRAAANVMPAGGLERWARFMARMAAPDGQLTMIHRADALQAILAALDGRFGDLKLKPVHPRAELPANRILIHGRKGSRKPMTLLPALIVHGAGQTHTPEVEAALRSGSALACF